MGPSPNKHELTGEGNLHDLTDDEFFDDLHSNPVKVYNADGDEVESLFDDIIDARAQKAAGVL